METEDIDNETKELRKKHAENISKIMDKPRLAAKDAMVKASIFHPADDLDKIIHNVKRTYCDACQICVVVDDEGRFVGEISIEDLIMIMAHTALQEPLIQILDTGYTRELNWKTAGDLAKKHNNIVGEETPIQEVLKKIYKKKFEYIIVTDAEDKVKGVITQKSLLRRLAKN